MLTVSADGDQQLGAGDVKDINAVGLVHRGGGGGVWALGTGTRPL